MPPLPPSIARVFGGKCGGARALLPHRKKDDPATVGGCLPPSTPGAARRMFRFALAARPRRYRLRNVAACAVAFSLRHPAYPYCGFV